LVDPARNTIALHTPSFLAHGRGCYPPGRPGTRSSYLSRIAAPV